MPSNDSVPEKALEADAAAVPTAPPGRTLPPTRAVPPLTRAGPGLGHLKLLDQLLALWIFLAMAVGIILGYFVPNTSVVLEKVQFVSVSLPLGTSCHT